jgi:hypothetical protein
MANRENPLKAGSFHLKLGDYGLPENSQMTLWPAQYGGPEERIVVINQPPGLVGGESVPLLNIQ